MLILKSTLYKFFFILLSLQLMACSSEEGKKTSEYKDVKFTAEQFLQNMFYRNFKEAELFCDNVSKSSVRKLSHFEYDYLDVYFKEIDTCYITKNTAECVCIYTNYDHEELKQSVQLKKYKNEWLVNCILDENFNNIFLYDFTNYPFDKNEKWVHNDMNTEAHQHLKSFISSINSNDFVLDFTSSFEVKNIDTNIINNSDYLLESNINLGDLNFYCSYSLDDEVLSDLALQIATLGDEDIQNYYKNVVTLLVKQLGRPFNVDANTVEKEFYTFRSLRWFVKGYNEIIELNFTDSSIIINMFPTI